MPEAHPTPSVDGLTVHRLSTTPADLGESPLWWQDDLWWIDGVAGRIHCRDGRGFDLGGHTGGIAPASDGRLVLSRDHEVLLFAPRTGATRALLTLPDADPLMRLNDVKLDRQGRFLSAGMGRDGTARGALHQLDGAGRHRVLHEGIRIGNGLCLSPDGATLYLADTPERKILACDYDPETGAAGPFRLHIDTAPHGSGVDGATVDAAGNLWAAMIHSAQIACFAPDGRLLEQIPAPTDLPSSLAFGGTARDRLFVTSIRDSGTGRAISKHPDGGHVFALDGLGSTGLPEALFTPAPEGAAS